MTTQTTSQSVNIGADYKVRVRKNAAGETTQIVASEGSSEFITGQVTISNAITAIVPARATRRSITITAMGTTDCFIGGDAVTTSTGLLLVGIKGGSFTFETTKAIYGITSSGTQSISYWEEYD